MIYCTYEDLFKPLPPPPPGKLWKKVRLSPEEQEAQDGATTRWELVDKVKRAPPGAADGSEGEEQPDGGEEGVDGADFIEVSTFGVDPVHGCAFTRPMKFGVDLHSRYCFVF